MSRPLVISHWRDHTTVWDDHTKSNINELHVEDVQRRTARFCHSNYQRANSVSDMIEDWEQLEARHQQLKAAMLYRIINHLVDIQATSLLIPPGPILEVMPTDSLFPLAVSTPSNIYSTRPASNSGTACQPRSSLRRPLMFSRQGKHHLCYVSQKISC